jgi:aminoglycoside phosphotransferase (APT) family kinase protein
LRGLPVEAFGGGWDNAAFLVDRTIVFRFPRRRIAAPLIERESRILPAIAASLPLAIPVPRFVGEPTPDYPWSFAGYARIDGATACSVELSDAARAALARPLAEFLRSLHRIDRAPLVGLGLPPDQIGRLDHAKRLRQTLERRPACAAGELAQSVDLGIAWLQAHPPNAPADAARTLVHGDLYARHLLLDETARPTGIIDWGDVHLGDPALDLAIAFLMLPAVAHTTFRDAYGPIDERTWSAARYRAIYHAILEYDYGIRVNDPGMRQIGATALRLLEQYE